LRDRYGQVALGPRPCRHLPPSAFLAHPAAARPPRRRRPRRWRRRHGQSRRRALHCRAGSIGQPALCPLRRFAGAVATLRLARPGARQRRRDPRSGAAAMTAKPLPAAPLPVTIADVRAAASTIAGEVLRTPSIAAPALSALTGADVVLKLETLHPTGSFKERGALNKLKSLSPEQRRAGIIAMSAGNHAQGVAYHAHRLGIPATIVMPEGTPFTKIERTAAHGATVVLRGAGLGEARQEADALAAERGLTL